MSEVVVSASTSASTIQVVASQKISSPFIITAVSFFADVVDVDSSIELYLSSDSNTDSTPPISGERFLPSSFSSGLVIPISQQVRYRSMHLRRDATTYIKLVHTNNSASSVSVTVILEIQLLSHDQLSKLI